MEIRALVERLHTGTNVIYSREPNWKVNEMTLFPPAQDADISRMSDLLPVPLPPSYREFLRVTNGCLGFWARFALLGGTTETQEPIRIATQDATDFLEQYVRGPDGSVTTDAILQFERGDDLDEQLYVPGHLVFGANQGGEFFVFDDRETRADGEYEVVHYKYDTGVYKRFADFETFLKARWEMVDKRLREKGYSSS